MATRSDRGGWSYAEFARLPSDDGNRYEVIAGELHVAPSPRPLHQRVLVRLTRLLDEFVEQHELGWVLTGPVDVLFSEDDYLAPDLVFVRRGRESIITDRGLEAAPDLIVEALSRSTADRDRGIKRERYALYRVPEYWVVDPEGRSIEVYDTGSGESPPIIARDTLTWRPVPDGPVLEFDVADALRGFER